MNKTKLIINIIEILGAGVIAMLMRSVADNIFQIVSSDINRAVFYSLAFLILGGLLWVLHEQLYNRIRKSIR